MLGKIKLQVLIIITAALLNTSVSAQQPVVFDNLTIVVSSCDKYSALWNPFFSLLFQQWPSLLQANSKVPILLIANSKSFANPRVQTINIPNEISWSDNMLAALDQVQTKYVMIALDDYWLDNPVNEQRLLEIYQAMQNDDAGMLHVSYNEPRWQAGIAHPTIDNMLYTDKFKHYKASLQLAIWDKETLKCLLRPGENPWEFELNGTARSHGHPKVFLSLAGDEPISYLNAMQQGYVNPNSIAYAEQQSIAFERADLPVLDKNNYKLTYKLWKGRAAKFFSMLRNPKAYFSAYYQYRIEVSNK